jgi:hypothetical protein
MRGANNMSLLRHSQKQKAKNIRYKREIINKMKYYSSRVKQYIDIQNNVEESVRKNGDLVNFEEKSHCEWMFFINRYFRAYSFANG